MTALDAYSLGGSLGTITRWAVLIAIAIVTVHRLRAGRYAAPRAAITLVVVGALAVGSALYDLGGDEPAAAEPAATAQAEVNFMAGCTDSGGPQAYCGCIWDRLVAAGIDTEAEMDAMTRDGSLERRVTTMAQACAAAR